jgi:hypothetical protein
MNEPGEPMPSLWKIFQTLGDDDDDDDDDDDTHNPLSNQKTDLDILW